jgi:hypothetical protein
MFWRGFFVVFLCLVITLRFLREFFRFLCCSCELCGVLRLSHSLLSVDIFLLFFFVLFVFFEQDTTFPAYEWAGCSIGTKRSVTELADTRPLTAAFRRVVSCRFRLYLPPRAVLLFFLGGSSSPCRTNEGGSVSADDDSGGKSVRDRGDPCSSRC